MPRVTYTSNPKAWANDKADPLNECMDFCKKCYEKGAWQDHIPEKVPYSFVYDEDQHPGYEEQWPPYQCRECKKELKEEDN